MYRALIPSLPPLPLNFSAGGHVKQVLHEQEMFQLLFQLKDTDIGFFFGWVRKETDISG